LFLESAPRAHDAVEMLDRPTTFVDLDENLDDIANFNAFFGGRWVTLRHVSRLLATIPADRVATVVDVGTGGGDIPRALVRWARRARRPIQVLALDLGSEILGAAASRMDGYPEITLIQGDALALPLRPHSVDVAISTHLLHHLAPAEAVRSLAEMDRVSQRGLVANDLFRSRVAHAVVWVTTRLLAKSPMSRHDGPLSVLRAYTPEEVKSLARRANLPSVRVHRYLWALRLCAVGTRSCNTSADQSLLALPREAA
jgi:ubiquinone/menaquinone biosynthesis C-methylase UbiE